MPSRGGASLRRRVGNRSPKKRVAVVCEGKKTEPDYLRLVNRKSNSALVELVIVDEPATTPKQLVTRACEVKRESARNRRKTGDPNSMIDEVWCVFDVDEHLLIKEARQQAAANGIGLCVSNPAIEIWFLFHFAPQSAYLERGDALTNLKSFVPDYEKGKVNLSSFEGCYDVAKHQAQKMDEKHEKDGNAFPNNNPSSNVWELIDALVRRA